MNTICVILAGGRSSRMGRDKAALPLGETTFLGRLIQVYAPAFPVYVSLARPGQFPHPGAGEIVDLRPGMGPLAGLEAAFCATDADTVFLTATDLPFGTAALAQTLLARTGGADICLIRRKDGQLEPTYGIYRRSCLAPIQTLLDQGRRAVRGLFDQVNVRWVEESELAGFDLERLLKNINTPESYRQALKDCGVTTGKM